MYVQEVITLPLKVTQTRDRVSTFLRNVDAVQHLSEQAFAHGVATTSSLGFGDLTRRVTVHAAPEPSAERAIVFVIRWTTTPDNTDQPLPILDATLTVEHTANGGSQITLRGEYRPAPGALTSTFDQILARHTGRRAAKAFLVGIGDAVMNPLAGRGQSEVAPRDRASKLHPFTFRIRRPIPGSSTTNIRRVTGEPAHP